MARGRDTLREALKNCIKDGLTDEQILAACAPPLRADAKRKLAGLRKTA